MICSWKKLIQVQSASVILSAGGRASDKVAFLKARCLGKVASARLVPFHLRGTIRPLHLHGDAQSHNDLSYKTDKLMISRVLKLKFVKVVNLCNTTNH